jgi:hypothetical protein
MTRSPLCKHGRKLCSDCIVADDAAKRCWEQVKNVAVHTEWAERINSFITVKLSDGSTDGVLYATKRDAVRHCHGNEQWFAFFSFRSAPEGFGSPKEAAIFLAWHRMAYDAGARLPDPDDARGGPDLIMPDAVEHLNNQLARLMRQAVN